MQPISTQQADQSLPRSGGTLAPGRPHILIVEARYYEALADALLAGAIAVIEENGASWDRVSVPGAFEVPTVIGLAGQYMRANRPRFDGYVALGCVIRGETSHYDYVCGESARGLMDLGIQRGLAIGNGILTVEDEDQAWERADHERMNKGGGAARAALAVVALKRTFGVSG